MASIPAFSHVVFVAMENQGFSAVIGSSDAPYINGTLVKGGALMTGMHGLGHPSFPNYVALFSGKALIAFQPGGDSCPPAGAPWNVPNMYSAITGAGHSFTTFAESYPGSPTACGPSPYAGRHVPAPWFTGVPSSSVKSFTSFPQTAAGWAALPAFSWVTPDLSHDMHSYPAYSGVPQQVQHGDSWLQANIDPYAQWAKANNSLLAVWWDEDFASADNPPLIFYGANVTPGKYGESVNHYNVLATVCKIFSATPPGAGATAAPITDIWSGGGQPPALQIDTTSLAQATQGSPYSAAFAASGGVSPYTWAETGGLPQGMSFTAGGVLSGSPASPGSYPVTFKVTDHAGTTATVQLTLTVASSAPPPPNLTIITTQLPEGTEGTAYTATLSARGGTGPYAWAETGQLPASVALSAAGVLSGLPGSAGSWPLTVKVTDSAGAMATQSLILTIQPASSGGGTGGGTTSGTVTGAAPLGAGVAARLQPSDGFADTYLDVFGMYDPAGPGQPPSPPPPPPGLTIVTPAVSQATTGAPYDTAIEASGGTPPYRWAETGALPSGMSFSPAGHLSGTAAAGTAGNYLFTVTVTDATGATAQAVYALSVADPQQQPPPPPAWTQTPDQTQPGWGGLLFTNKTVPAGFTAISATFTIPALTGHAGALCSVWIGIGNVQQTGLYLAYDATKPGNCHASPWTWYLPAAEIWDETTYPYQAGDKVTLSLAHDDDYWYVTQANHSRGWSFTEQKSIQAANIGGVAGDGEYLFPPAGAEVIIEKEGGNDLPAYGTLEFDSITLTPSTGTYARCLTNYTGSQENQQPSLFTGDSFTMLWEAYS